MTSALEANVSTEPVETAPEALAPAYGSQPQDYGTYVIAEPAEPIVAVPMPPAEEVPADEGDHTEEGA